MAKRVQRWVAAAALASVGAALPAFALSLGMVDTFQSGADGGWSAGVASINPPTVVSTGGPAGAGDGYLFVVSTGGLSAGSKLTAIAGPQWTGDYTTAGVDHITLDVNNFGATDLQLRLWLAGPPGASLLSTSAVLVPAGSGWTAISFALDASALTGQLAATLAGVQQLRLFHGTSAAFPGEAIAAALGVDNVTAVPEPAPAWLLLGGLVALTARRGRAARKPQPG